MEILGEHIDKKHLLYIGGAVASLVGLVWLMKRRSSAGQAIAPAGAVPSSAATGASTADQQIAASLEIERGRERIAEEQIASAEKIAAINAAAAIKAAGYKSTSAQVGALAPGIGAAGTAATKGIFDILKDLITGTPTSEASGGQIYPGPIGPNLPPGYVLDTVPEPGSPNFIGPMLPPDYNVETGGYNTSTAGGSSDYFGSGLPSDEGGGLM